MSIITAILTFAILHVSVSAQTIKLGCLSAAPSLAEPIVLDSPPGPASLLACTTSCAVASSSYAYYSNSTSACSCGPALTDNDLYVDAIDHYANCSETSTWYTAISNYSTAETTSSCPSIGPTSTADLPGYIYLSSFPDPLACHSACEAAGLGLTLIQPGMSGYSCACAQSIEGETFTEVCNSQSWYAVEKA